MKRYVFSLTKKEAAHFCIRAFWEQQRMRAFQWAMVLVIALIDLWIVPWAGITVFGMVLLILLVALLRNISVMGKDLCGKPQAMWVEDGILKVERSGYGEILGSSIGVVRVTKDLLMLGIYQAKKQIVWYAMPNRVFLDEREREAFLASLRKEPLPDRGQESKTEGETQEGTFVWQENRTVLCFSGFFSGSMKKNGHSF